MLRNIIKILLGLTVVVVLSACQSKKYEEPQEPAAELEPAIIVDDTVEEEVVEVPDETTIEVPYAISRIYFNFDKSDLREVEKDKLDQQVEWLKEHSDTHVIIEGHTDDVGTREYNLALGERRAYSVKKYLISQGIEDYRIRVVSYGEDKPSVLGEDEDARSENRRTVTIRMASE